MSKRIRSAMEMIGAVRRMLRAAGEHVGDADQFELAELVALRDELEDVIRTAVHAQRRFGRSWQDIGDALGVKRQSAYERYGREQNAQAGPPPA